MVIKPFDAESAINYAHKYALSRNPLYYSFDAYGLGGDCTNFISQSIYAGSGAMNYTPTFGWYYKSLNNRSPSWTGVEYLYNFLTTNKGSGPFGEEIALEGVKPGDIIQLSFDGISFSHSLIVLQAGENPQPDNILIACHTYDALLKPLDNYYYQKLRVIRIKGVRKL